MTAAASDAGRDAARGSRRIAACVLVAVACLLAGPAGFAQPEAPAGPPVATLRTRLPRTLGFGEATFGPLSLRPTLNLQAAGFADANAGFDGAWAAGPLDEADVWFEHSNEVGLNAVLDAGRYGTLKARVSGVFTLTTGGLDAAVSSGADFNQRSYTLEDAYLLWQSGHAFASLGFNAVEVGYGNQNYQVFDGLLFWDGAADGALRGATWLTPRRAFREAGLVRVNLAAWTIEGVHLAYNDDPDTHTRVGAGRVEYASHNQVLRSLKTGFMYFNVYASDVPSRDGLNGFYLYHEGTPFAGLPALTYTTSFVAETNSRRVGLSQAYGWFVAPAYELRTLPWSPQLSYRYASFSGGGSRNFDSLFTGLSDWGSWFQGELLGEFVLSNSNLNSHMVRLELTPADGLTLNLFYWKFLLDDRQQDFGPTPARVASHALADEVDVILDLTVTNWWSMTAAFTAAVPNDGFREATGGNDTWINSMLYVKLNF